MLVYVSLSLILSPSETGFIVSVNRLNHITMLTLVQATAPVLRGVVDLHPNRTHKQTIRAIGVKCTACKDEFSTKSSISQLKRILSTFIICCSPCVSCLPTIPIMAFHGSWSGPSVGSDFFQKLADRAGSGWVKEVIETSWVSSVGSGGFHVSRDGSGPPVPIRPARSDPTRKNPWYYLPVPAAMLPCRWAELRQRSNSVPDRP